MWTIGPLKVADRAVDALSVVARTFFRRRAGGARRVLALLSVVLIAFLGVVANPAQASPADPSADEAQFVALLNRTRARGGLPPLTVDGELTALARAWAQHQADDGHISHANPISAGVTADWLKLGENVGTGGNVQVVMDAFIASPGHYANIMDPEFTKVGVGVVWVGNALYTTHRFMKLAPVAAPDPTPQEAAPAPATPDPAPVAAAREAEPAPAAPATSAPRPTVPVTTTTAAPAPVAPPAPATRVATVLAALIAAGR